MEKKKDMEKQKTGFANMDPARQREIASLGGKAVPHDRRSFSQDRELAARAGSTGGSTPRGEKDYRPVRQPQDE